MVWLPKERKHRVDSLANLKGARDTESMRDGANESERVKGLLLSFLESKK